MISVKNQEWMDSIWQYISKHFKISILQHTPTHWTKNEKIIKENLILILEILMWVLLQVQCKAHMLILEVILQILMLRKQEI